MASFRAAALGALCIQAVSAFSVAPSPAGLRAVGRNPARVSSVPRFLLPVRGNKVDLIPLRAVKESPLEAGGERGLEEEERRISLWKTRFELTDEQIASLRMSFEKALEDVPGNTRAIPKDVMRRVIEKASGIVDTVDVSKDGRPAVSQEELTNYIKALPGLWSETCDNDAVETANGECLVPLDMDNFDLSESVAVFGMCLRDHCGIGGVCFWDTPTTPTSSKPKEW